MLLGQKELDEALDLKQLKLPASLPVLRLDAENYTDNTGEETIRIHVLLDESTDIDHLSGADVGDFKWAIRESLRNYGVTTFVYFKFAKPSELAEMDDED